MANILFKSITFPGLPNKYTVPEISSDLMTAGKAADAKKTGDALSALEDQFSEETDKLKADLGSVNESVDAIDESVEQFKEVADTITGDFVSFFDIGNIGITENGWVYNNSFTTRVRTKNGVTFHLPAGRVIGLSDYTNAKYYIGWRLEDGTYGKAGWLTADYTTQVEGDYVILIVNKTEATVSDVADLASLFFGLGAEIGIYKKYETYSKQEIDGMVGDIEDVSALTEKVNVIIGHNVTFTEGSSYFSGGVTIGSSTDSAYQTTNATVMCTTFLVPAGSILRISAILGNKATSGTRAWRAYRTSDNILVGISDNVQTRVVDYIRFDFETRIYVNTLKAEDYFVGIADEKTAFYDIYKQNLEPKTSIMDLNKDALYTLKTMRRGVRNKTRPFILCHFSDIHADSTNLSRIVDFLTKTSGYIDDTICTGDMVYQSIDDGMDWWDAVSGTGNIMLAIGNHECAKGTSSITYNSATPAEVYAEVLADRIGSWSVTQPSDASANGLGYYYKDYATWKLRIIVLDLNHDSAYLSAQLTWLASVLSDAITNGLSVIIASHYQFASTDAELMDCGFSHREGINAEGNGWAIPADYVTAVDTFITGGGEFVCWLAGHGHQDYVLLNTAGTQISIAVTTANFALKNAWSFGDDYREAGHRSQDAFNIVGIDTYSKHITLYRVGNNLSRLGNSRNHCCIDYANRKIVWSD